MGKLAGIFSSLSKSLISQFGRKATLKQVTKGAYNPTSGQSTTISTKEIMILQGTYSSRDFRYGVDENQGLQLGDIPIYSSDILDKNDTILIDGVEYAILHVSEYVAEDKTVLYFANIRGSK